MVGKYGADRTMHTNILVCKMSNCSMEQTILCWYEVYVGMEVLGSEMKKSGPTMNL